MQYLHCPVDFGIGMGYGYAYITFSEAVDAQRFTDHFDGLDRGDGHFYTLNHRGRDTHHPRRRGAASLHAYDKEIQNSSHAVPAW